MKKAFPSLILVFLLPLFLSAQGVEFIHGDWEKALKQAKEEEKLIFVDAYAQWCGPCKKMAKDVFPQERVGEYFNSHFINLKMDMENGEGPEFGKEYPVRGFPTLMFIKPDGELLHQVVGARDVNGLLQVGAKAFSMFDKNSEYRTAYKEEGKRDYETVYGYILSLKKKNEPTIKVANEYLDSDPQITDEQKLKLIFAAAREADSKLYEEALENKNKIIEMVGEEEYEKQMIDAVMRTVKKAVEFQYEPLKNDAIASLKQVNKSKSDYHSTKANMLYYSLMKNKQEFLKAAKKLHKLSDKNSLTEQMEIAQQMTRAFHDSETKRMAASYVEKAFNNSDSVTELLNAAELCVNCDSYELAQEILKSAKSLNKSIVKNRKYQALKQKVESARG